MICFFESYMDMEMFDEIFYKNHRKHIDVDVVRPIVKFTDLTMSNKDFIK